MPIYMNDKGQSQSPVMTFGPTVEVPNHKLRVLTTKPTPYIMVWGHVPIDTAVCQCPTKFEGSQPRPKQIRCDRPATTVAVENAPRTGNGYPSDGYICAYSCCDQDREHIIRAHGPGYAKFTPIVP